MNEYYAMEDHMRFFAFTSEVDFSKKNPYLLMAVHKDSIPVSQKQKDGDKEVTIPILDNVWFFKEDKKGKKTWFKGNTKGGKNNTKLLDESREAIIFIVTDSDGKAVLRQGKPIYTSMPPSRITDTITLKGGKKKQEVYRYGKADLQGEPESHTATNNKTYYTAKNGKILLKPKVRSLVESHTKRREAIIGSSAPMYFKVSNHSTPMVKRYSGPKSKPSKSISANTKMINLQVNLSPASTSKVDIGGRSVTLNSGMAYVVKNGKLVPVQHNLLHPSAQETIYQLFLKYAENRVRRDEGEISLDAAELIDPDNPDSPKIFHILKSMVFFGEYTQDSTAPTFDMLNTSNGFKVQFGDHAEIEMQHLLNSEGNSKLHQDFKDFIGTLHYNVNNFLLKKDQHKRNLVDEWSVWNKLKEEQEEELKKQKAYKDQKAKDKKEGTGKKYQNIWLSTKINEWAKKPNNARPVQKDIVFDEFTEYKINEKGEVSSSTWVNYTDFLLGDGVKETKRENMDQYPLWTNLADMTSKDDKNYHRTPQFVNTYLTYSREPVTLKEVKKKKEKKKEDDKPAEESKVTKDLEAVKSTTLLAKETNADFKGLKFVLHENSAGSVTNIEILEEPALPAVMDKFNQMAEALIKDTSANADKVKSRFDIAPDPMQTLEGLTQTQESTKKNFTNFDTNSNPEQTNDENCGPTA